MKVTARGLVLRLLLCGLVILLTVGTSGTPAGADPTAGPDRKDPLPVSVELTEITPAVSTGDEPIQIKARLTNNGAEPITDPWIRLQRHQRVSSRGALQALDDKQPSYTSALSQETDLDLTLAPGSTSTVELSIPRTSLLIYDSGAYPILLNVQGSIDGFEERVGQAAFTLPRSAVTPAPPVTVSWVLPLIDRPHRFENSDLFLDDALTEVISGGGRLENLLSAAETYAATTDLTLVVDPDLVGSLVAMADGYQVATDAGHVEGSGAQAAAAFLERLRDVADTTPVIATPYADVDTVALVRAGLSQVVTDAREDGARIVADALETTPITDIVWPADGILTDAAWQVLQDDGVDTALLSGSSFGQQDYLESEDGITENAATVLSSGRAIVADPGLSRLLAESPQYVAGPVAATQRIVAELAMIADQAPQRERNVVLLPPRDWAPSEELLDQLLATTSEQPWINPASLGQIAQGEPQDRGALDYPAHLSTRELPAAQLAELSGPLTQIDELSTAFDETSASAALWPARSAIYHGSSSAWRGGTGQPVSAGAAGANAALSHLRSQIRIVTPSGGKYTLASSDAPLVFTVENNLPYDVHYRIGVDESRSTGLSTADIGVQTIPAGTRATVQLPSRVERSGTFTVVAQIRTPDNKPLGNDVQINVSSSAYGTAALWVTGVAFSVLLALIARRWWRRHLFWATERRKRAAAEEHQRLEQAGDYGPHEYQADDPATDDDPDMGDDQHAGDDPDTRHAPDAHHGPDADDGPDAGEDLSAGDGPVPPTAPPGPTDQPGTAEIDQNGA